MNRSVNAIVALSVAANTAIVYRHCVNHSAYSELFAVMFVRSSTGVGLVLMKKTLYTLCKACVTVIGTFNRCDG